MGVGCDVGCEKDRGNETVSECFNSFDLRWQWNGEGSEGKEERSRPLIWCSLVALTLRRTVRG